MWRSIAAVEHSALAETLRGSLWAYPILEMVHITAFATVFGSLLLIELRVFGAAPDLALQPLTRLAVRTALTGFAFAAASGLLLWSTDAVRVSANPAFVVKLGLIAAAGINAAIFHWRGSVRLHDRVARLQALLSLALWMAVIAAGRLIAYL